MSELPYSDRVTGIGDFKFVPVPRPSMEEASMAELWQQDLAAAEDEALEAAPEATVVRYCGRWVTQWKRLF